MKIELRPQDKIAFAVFLAVEAFFVAFSVRLAGSISKSVTFVQESAKKLADGEISTTLERRKNSRGENEVTDLILNLEKTRLSLQEEFKRKERLIMGMSHDLRTPVAVIKGYAETISDGLVSEKDEIQKSVQTILSKAEQLENMINTLINFVKMENSSWEGTKITQAIEPVLQDFVNTYVSTGAIFKRRVSGSVNVSKETLVSFDKELLQRALSNLFSNALRYTRDNDSIILKAEENTDKITITVEDSGIGISKEDIQYIFDFMYRATNSRREVGHGIGLSVVKNIVDSHGWSIKVDSQIGMGTVFTIEIPKTDSDA